MTKFSEEFQIKVQTYWAENKNKVLGKKEDYSFHLDRKVIREKKFTMHDLSEHFGITEGQAKRIVYILPKANKHKQEV